MGDQRKRQRTESLIKISTQKKESKLRYEEANSHIKSGNLEKAIFSYNKVIKFYLICSSNTEFHSAFLENCIPHD